MAIPKMQAEFTCDMAEIWNIVTSPKNYSWRSDISRIEFTGDVTAKKNIMKPFVKGYLKKQQQKYIADLRRELENRQ